MFVSMPRRAEFIFYQVFLIIVLALFLVAGFQCPEGLNLFSITILSMLGTNQ